MKIQLINMPFSSVYIPSFALTQIKSVLDQQFAGRVLTEVHYLNHDFATYLGQEIYDFIAESMAAHSSGFGDWFFRQAAFPERPENSRDYFKRYGVTLGSGSLQTWESVLREKRDGLPAYLDSLIDRLGLEDANITGFTSMFFQTLASAAMARRIKERNPRCMTLMGGANCEARMGIELAHHLPMIDFTFSGPALVNLPAMIGRLLEGDTQAIHRLDGVFSKLNSRSIAANGDLKPDATPANVGLLGRELDINEVIDLNYDGFLDSFDARFPKTRQQPYLLFETSRGCWWGQKSHCTFCGLNGGTMNYRAMKPEQALGLLNRLFERYSGRVSHFSSVDNIVPKEYLSDLFPRLKVPEHVTLFYEVKADLKKRDMEVLSEAHVFDIQPGIEALSSLTLRLMRKGTTAFGNIAFLKNAARFGIKPCWNLLIGFPGEPKEVFEKYMIDLPRLTHLPPPSGTFPVRFDRFSPYFDQAETYNLKLKPLDFYDLSYGFEPAVLMGMAYYFSDQHYQADYIRASSLALSGLREKVAVWRRRWLGEDKLPLPRLYLTEDGSGVRDSRSGVPVIHPVSAMERELIEVLEEACTLDFLAKTRTQFEPEAIAEALERLTGLGLLFAEKDRWISLVFAEEPRAPQRTSFHLARLLLRSPKHLAHQSVDAKNNLPGEMVH